MELIGYIASFINDIGISADDVIIALSLFFIYSFLGWCVESAYISWMNKKWTNRGFLYAPICPIYGIGEFFGYRLLLLLPKNYVLIFIIGTAFATTLEFAVAKYMIWKTGYLWWDYTNRPFNYKGILCLESTLAWGVYAVVELAFLHDALESLLRQVPILILGIAITLLFIYIFVDLGFSIRRFRTEGMQAEANNILKVR